MFNSDLNQCHTINELSDPCEKTSSSNLQINQVKREPVLSARKQNEDIVDVRVNSIVKKYTTHSSNELTNNSNNTINNNVFTVTDLSNLDENSKLMQANGGGSSTGSSSSPILPELKSPRSRLNGMSHFPFKLKQITKHNEQQVDN